MSNDEIKREGRDYKRANTQRKNKKSKDLMDLKEEEYELYGDEFCDEYEDDLK